MHGIAPTQSAPYQNYTDTLGEWDYLATGGRVLAVGALGRDLSDARRLAYEVVGNLHFDGLQLRSDIGKLR
jgi:phosphoribosylamine--glycine ligase